MGWLMDAANWFNDNLGFGAIDKVGRDLFGVSTVPSALQHSSIRASSSSGGTFYPGSLSSSALAEMNYNSVEADKARKWQEHMRDTQLSSAFSQARSEGINPYVMFNGGGVSAPGAGAASYSGYASAERSSQQSGMNAFIGALSALSVAKTPKTTIVVK